LNTSADIVIETLDSGRERVDLFDHFQQRLPRGVGELARLRRDLL
jgi:hypothetical protein